MNNITILILGLMALVAGFFFWKRIQVSRKGDRDFDRRDEVMEENL